ncbi:MAG: TlpA family protein disulfide reductase [Gammaproteobacteria bacterium]
MKAATRVLIAATALAAAAAGGFVAYRLLMPTPTVVRGTAAAPPATPNVSPTGRSAAKAIPDRLPDITLTDRDGKPRQLSEWAGRPLLINFWATWCAPCRREIPLLKTLRAERASEGLEVIGIAVDFRDAVLEYAREIGLDYPLLIGEQDGLDAAAAFGMDIVLPFSIFADRDGRIVTLKVGELHADEARYILDTVREVDAKRLEPGPARQRIALRLKELAADRAVDGDPDRTPPN